MYTERYTRAVLCKNKGFFIKKKRLELQRKGGAEKKSEGLSVLLSAREKKREEERKPGTGDRGPEQRIYTAADPLGIFVAIQDFTIVLARRARRGHRTIHSEVSGDTQASILPQVPPGLTMAFRSSELEQLLSTASVAS